MLKSHTGPGLNWSNKPERSELDCTPLHIACQNNNIEMVKLLLDEGANVNAKSGEPEVDLIVPN